MAAAGRIAIAVLALGVGLSACSGTKVHRGYIVDHELLEDITPGVDNKQSIEAMMGSPSVNSMFNDNTWYYITRTSKHWAFFKPKPLEQEVIAINFDADGNVTDMKQLTLADAREVDMVGRKTPTRGRQLGFFQQIFSNIGRFNRQGPVQPGQ